MYKTLGEVGVLYSGLKGKSKDDFRAGNARYVPYKNVFKGLAVDFGYLETVKVAPSERQNAISYGDILFTASSESVEELGMSAVVMQHPANPVYLNSFCFGLRLSPTANISPGYAKHLFRSAAVRKAIMKTGAGVTRINISKERFKKILIPIPSLAEQARVVAILDKFEALTNSLTEGLPQEIELRRKQYEYYREQLLSFPA